MEYRIYYFGQYSADFLAPGILLGAGDNLWVTNGTGAGTMLAEFQESFGGPPTGRLTPVDGRVFFSAPDTTGNSNTTSELWLADTANHAAQVGDNTHSYASPGYITDADGTVFFINFLGGDAEPFVTNGTVGGTTQLANVNAGNASLYSMTNVDGEVFFFATRGSATEVWKSDGTPGGTTMVASLAGTAGTPSGPESGDLGQFSDPRGQVEFNGQLFFGTSRNASGNGSFGDFTLSKTDGSTVTALPAYHGGGNAYDLAAQPEYLTPFSLALPFIDPNNENVHVLIFEAGGFVWAATSDGNSVFPINTTASNNDINVGASDLVASGNRVFFAGQDENFGHSALWEITNTGFGWDTNIVQQFGASAGRIHDITDIGGGTVFFVVNDGAHGSELWKYATDENGFGTASIVKDLSIGSSGSDPHNLVDIGGELYFQATTDGGTSYQLYKSDGTDNGTVEVSPQNVEERLPIAFAPDLTVKTRPTDFNGDFHSGILTVAADGAVLDVEMNGEQVVSRNTLTTLGGSAVALLGSGDFDGDATTDLLIGNTNGDAAHTVNTVSIAHVVNSHVVSTNTIGTLANTIKWQFQGVGDFNGDGVADVLWRDAASEGGSGHFIVWIIGGAGTVVSPNGEDANIGTPTLTANFLATGDFNGDGRSDILMNDQGVLETWEMNGTTITGGGTIGTIQNGMTFVGVGDFNGDGHADILFVDDSGTYSTWDVNGTKIMSTGSIGNPGPGFVFSAIGDYNNDGKSDILFKSQVNDGSSFIWQLNDRAILNSGSVGSGPIDGGHFGDFDGDGKADLLWRNADGFVASWKMGATITANFITGVSSDYHSVGIGDLNGDHKADVLWQKDDGSLLAWLMQDSANIATVVGLDTQPLHTVFAGVGDFNGDGNSDWLWRNTITGEVTVRTMAGSSVSIDGTGNDWSITGVGDFNGDGKDDVLFRHNSDGANAIWLMDGTQNPTTLFLNGVSADWHVVGTGNFDGDANHTTDVFWHNDNGANAIWIMGASGQPLSAVFFDGVSSDWHVVGTGDVNHDGKDDVIWRNDAGATAIWQMNGANTPSVSFPGGVPNDWATQAHHYDYV